jgi:segregation and condensation protein A
MRDTAAKLMARDRLGRDRFVRGVTEDMMRRKTVHYTANLLDLMQGYARIRTKDDFRPFVMDRDSVFTMEQALNRMRGLIGFAGHWTDIASYLPEGWSEDPKKRRSATASTFAASLELAKEGKIEIRQEDVFSPIKIRKKVDRDG